MQPSLRILVVEDLHDSADSLGLLLKLWGYQAVITYDGAGALAAASAIPPDVALLDIGLPGMDGYEVARQLRRLPGMATALLVAITGYGRNLMCSAARKPASTVTSSSRWTPLSLKCCWPK